MIINPAKQVHGEEEINAARSVIESGSWADGEPNRMFETALAKYHNMKYATLVNSGTSANFAAILALTTRYVQEKRRINPGDEVITTALSFPTTVSPIVYAGAVPIFVDVERGSWNIDTDQVLQMITERTKAIIVAHALGNPFNVKALKQIAVDYGITLIEDNCDCLGGEVDGQKTGSFGDVSTCSFYPAHHISTGEGGVVMTNNTQIQRGINAIVNWGRDCWCRPGCDDTCGARYSQQHGELPFGYDHKNTYSEFGFNFKMSSIQAAIGIEQLKRLAGFVDARRYNHAFLSELFGRYSDWFEATETYEDTIMSPFGYVVKLTDRAPFTKSEFEQYLNGAGIRSRAFFCGNITRQPVLSRNARYIFRKHSDLSVSDDIMNNAFWIGVHPGIGEAERQYMEEAITKFLSSYYED